MSRSMPPLNPLRVFEVAARAGSFTEAGDILGVTPSAISRQVAVLEQFLDTRLFHRTAQGNSLTATGIEYFKEIEPAFQIISSATGRLRKDTDVSPLKLRVPYTFGNLFLIPRLSIFRKLHPNITINISTGFAPVNFTREDVDLAIQMGTGDWPGASCKILFPSWLKPICSRAIMNGDKPLKTIDDLQNYPLIVSRNRPDDWHHWFAAMGRPDLPVDKAEIIELPNSSLTYQAAADSVGIALGQFPMLSQYIQSYDIITLFDQPVQHSAYYAVWRTDAGPKLKARQFLWWLERELKAALGSALREAPAGETAS